MGAGNFDLKLGGGSGTVRGGVQIVGMAGAAATAVDCAQQGRAFTMSGQTAASLLQGAYIRRPAADIGHDGFARPLTESRSGALAHPDTRFTVLDEQEPATLRPARTGMWHSDVIFERCRYFSVYQPHTSQARHMNHA